ncbi:MAG: purine-nucleoside phosphorylase [Ignavibacteria bacterium]|jgi:purine-nucleoside phosphorylase
MPIDSKQVDESLECINREIGDYSPKLGIVLGTGLGGLVRDVKIKHRLDYKNIPHFPVSTVEFHHGNLIFGSIADHDAMIMQGRFHYYEGYSLDEVTYPILVMQKLGIDTLLVSNACGAVNPTYHRGDLMIMCDHINLLFDTPLKKKKISSSNKRIYDPGLIEIAEKTALEYNIPVRKGVYCALSGPNLETRSEYRMVRKTGADVVGMSTIPEALASKNGGFKVLGFSIITDVGFPDSLKPAVIEDIIETAAKAEPKLTLLMENIIRQI